MNDCNKTALVGKYFHSFEGGKLCLQGRVLSQESDGIYLVETYDWLVGQTYDMKLVRFEDMIGWKFYQTREDLSYHSSRYTIESF